MQTEASNVWRKCSSCKNPIALGAKYYICSVSTCSGPRTGYVFCSIDCFESHLPGARHREAGAVEKVAPMTTEAATSSEPQRTPARIIVKASPTSMGSAAASKTAAPQEVLIIASRLKEFIQARSEFNTSASVMDVLSDHVRILCDRAIDNARAEGRKTVLDRDFDFLKRS
ncbi:hypothetical protein D3C87_339600 [compost metagenome]